MPFRPIRRCAKCAGVDVSRSRRRSFFERYVLRFALLRPYHCWACNHRFYGYRYARKAADAPARNKSKQAASNPDVPSALSA